MRNDPLPAFDIGARLDRLPWSRTHTTIVVALGAGWLFDSFEVQLFSSAIGPLGDHFGATSLARSGILAVWLVGILLGALFGGPLADRFGRRRLFVLTLLGYAGFTVLTGLSPTLWLVYLLRLLAALGVGAEYAVINAAVAELIPARVRGRANAVVMNFWPAGAVAAGLLAYLVLDTLALSSASSWRVLFILGGLLALLVLVFRRRIPESPRWLLARGRTREAEEILTRLEGATEVTGPQQRISQGSGPQQEHATPLDTRAALGELVRRYPARLALGAALDLAEAFGYYGIFALLAVVVLPAIHLSQAAIPVVYILGNIGGLVGGLAMSSVFDAAGRKRTVAACYLGSAVSVGLLAAATASGSATLVTLGFALSSALATAAWTSAYPMFTELFPTHLRGAGVGASVAVGRAGAIIGTLALPA
ncbi:MAG: MFS transporter, partial [Sciscionella sp.]